MANECRPPRPASGRQRTPSSTATRPEIAMIPSTAKPRERNPPFENLLRQAPVGPLRRTVRRATSTADARAPSQSSGLSARKLERYQMLGHARSQVGSGRRHGFAVPPLSPAIPTAAEKGRRTQWEGYRVRLSRSGSKTRLRDGITPVSRALPGKVKSPTATFDRAGNTRPGPGLQAATAAVIRHLLSPSCYRRAIGRGWGERDLHDPTYRRT